MVPERFVVAFGVGSNVTEVPELDVPGEIQKRLHGQGIGVPVETSKKKMKEKWEALQEWAHRHGISYIRANVQNAQSVRSR